MAVNGVSSIGSCMAFSATLAADPKGATEYAALTWTDWAGITEMGDLGGTDDIQTVTPVCDGIVQKIHGARDNGTQNMEALFDDTDAGQIIIQAAYDNRTKVAVRLTLATTTIFYYEGIVTSAAASPGNAGTILMIKPTVAITSNIVKVASS